MGVILGSSSTLAPQAVGLKLYLDETFGDMTTREPAMLAQVFEAWPGPGPIAIHAESRSIAVALSLAERYGQRVHICHVPHPDDLLAIEAARQRGVPATCEVTPHHLFLTDEAVRRLGAYAQMKPPLVSPAEVALYWERLSMVDIIGTDHAPHTRAEKESPTSPPGVPGLETVLPLMLYAVGHGRLSLQRMIDLTHYNTLRIYGLCAPQDSAWSSTWANPIDCPSMATGPAAGGRLLWTNGRSGVSGVSACGDGWSMMRVSFWRSPAMAGRCCA